MQTRTFFPAILLVLAALPGFAEELGSTTALSNAVYSVDTTSSLDLRAVQGARTSRSLIIANNTRRPIHIRYLNGDILVIVKAGTALDLGVAAREFPDAVVIAGAEDENGHYVRLTRGLVLTAFARAEDVS